MFVDLMVVLQGVISSCH